MRVKKERKRKGEVGQSIDFEVVGRGARDSRKGKAKPEEAAHQDKVSRVNLPAPARLRQPSDSTSSARPLRWLVSLRRRGGYYWRSTIAPGVRPSTISALHTSVASRTRSAWRSCSHYRGRADGRIDAW